MACIKEYVSRALTEDVNAATKVIVEQETSKLEDLKAMLEEQAKLIAQLQGAKTTTTAKTKKGASASTDTVDTTDQTDNTGGTEGTPT